MVMCSRLLNREILEVRQTPLDDEHILFTIPAEREAATASAPGAVKTRSRRAAALRHPLN